MCYVLLLAGVYLHKGGVKNKHKNKGKGNIKEKQTAFLTSIYDNTFVLCRGNIQTC